MVFSTGSDEAQTGLVLAQQVLKRQPEGGGRSEGISLSSSLIFSDRLV